MSGNKEKILTWSGVILIHRLIRAIFFSPAKFYFQGSQDTADDGKEKQVRYIEDNVN